MRKSILHLAVLAVGLTGCVRHIRDYEPRKRLYQPAQYGAARAEPAPGSLWNGGSPGMFEDARARRVGDVVTIRIDERAEATRDTSTRTSRESNLGMGVSSFFTAMTQLQNRFPGLDPASLLSANAASNFDGEGSTSRSGRVVAVLTVRIADLMPNGDFFVEGNKVVLLNEEETHLYVSGVVRPSDISPDNTVSSAYLADVELEYTGRGVLSERQSPGWLARALDYIWPF